MPGLLIHNPRAGGHNEELIPRLAEALGEVTTHTVDEVGPDILTWIKAQNCDWIAVAGGDGTVENFAKALLGSDIALGVIAVGTYNNFARSLDLPLDPMEACEVIRTGYACPIDVGQVNGMPFFECVGVGLDAALFPLGEQIKSGRMERFLKFFRLAYAYKKHAITITLDRPIGTAYRPTDSKRNTKFFRHIINRKESSITLSALMLTVSNGPYYGMNFAVAPEQRMDDGLLTVTVFRNYNKLQLWWHFFSIAFGRREYRPKPLAFRSARVEISSIRSLPIHLDGNPEKLWPLEITCQPAALRVFRGKNPA